MLAVVAKNLKADQFMDLLCCTVNTFTVCIFCSKKWCFDCNKLRVSVPEGVFFKEGTPCSNKQGVCQYGARRYDGHWTEEWKAKNSVA